MSDVSQAPPADELRPSRALLSPAWLLSLAVLIANDHWLKGAGLLPEVVTGKLSDLAGMIVAPVLLAVLLRVRTRWALAGCHAAVALVFAAIQLSPSFAGTWSALMGVLGYPWTITCDPTDLLALPCLGLSWMLLVPHMHPERSPLAPLQRTAVAGLAAIGLWSSVATTEGPEFEPFYSPVYGNLFINNANEVDLALHVRYLREGVRLDCNEVAADPGRVLGEAAFGEAEHWLIPPRANIGLELSESDDCDAVWVAGEGIEPTILFVNLSSYGPDFWPGSSDADTELLEPELRIELDAEGRASWTGAEDVRFTPRTDTPAQPDSCEAPAGESRIDWPQVIPERPAEILALEPGLDGCFEFDLQDMILDGDQVVPDGEPHAFFVCAPAEAVPFAVGELVGFDMISNPSGTRELDLTLLDPVDLEPATDPEGSRLLNVRLLHGGNDPQWIGPAIERELEAVPAEACGWQHESGCATAERIAGLRVVGAADPLVPGVPVEFASLPGGADKLRTTILAYMRQRAIVDPDCSQGSLQLRYDIDLAVVERPLL